MANAYAFAVQWARTWNRADTEEIRRLRRSESALRKLDDGDRERAA